MNKDLPKMKEQDAEMRAWSGEVTAQLAQLQAHAKRDILRPRQDQERLYLAAQKAHARRDIIPEN